MSDGAVVVAIGASAGGLEALHELVAGLPGDLPAAVLIVVHVPSAMKSRLPEILDRSGALPVVAAEHGAPLRAGTVAVGPPDHHLLVNGRAIELDRGPRINGHRPAIDPLFRSVAAWYGSRSMGVLLSGMLDDGTAGLLRMAHVGAMTVAQDPEEALFPDMPSSAIARGAAREVLPVAKISELIVSEAHRSDLSLEEVVAMQVPAEPTADAKVSPFTCPNCHGTLWEIDEHGEVRFRCRIGHAYSIESLVQESTSALDDALWAAYRALLEQADLCRRMARRMRSRGMHRLADRYEDLATDAERRAWVVHDALVTHEGQELREPGGQRG
jgi:two-component system chemotaxis response regulator CheB